MSQQQAPAQTPAPEPVASTAQPPQQSAEHQANTQAERLDDRIANAAKQQAQADAFRVIERAHQVYCAELESELSRLMNGQGIRDYFRAELPSLALPNTLVIEQFEGRTVDALPSAD